jgi:hypothetical protein
MATAKRIIVVLVLALLTRGTALSAQPQPQQPPKQISNTRQASCAVQITTNRPDIFQSEAIMTLIRSPSVFGKAAREVIGEPDQTDIRPGVTIQQKEDNILYTINLDVRLTKEVEPMAEELLKATVKNLTTEISNIYKSYIDARKLELSTEEQKLKSAQSELEKSTKENLATHKFSILFGPTSITDRMYEQLEKTVSLSMLNPEMTLGEVLNIIKDSVKSPLQIQPNWKDLRETAGITPDTPAELDPFPSIKVGKALDVLMAGLSTEEIKIDYVLADGLIVIATKDKLPNKMVTITYDVSGLVPATTSTAGITRAITEGVEPQSWHEKNTDAKGTITSILGNKLSITQTPQIQYKIQNFLQSLPIEIPAEPVAGISVENLQADKEALSRDKRKLDMEIARLEARKKEIEKQIAVINDATPSKIKDDTILAELQKILENQINSRNETQRLFESGLISTKEIIGMEDPISRTKIEIAKRREELGKTLGGEQLSKLNDQLSSIMIDYAETKAELAVMDTQLSQLDSQISASVPSTDPNIIKIRQAKQAVENAQKRLNEINAKIANLQEPAVTVIGLN